MQVVFVTGNKNKYEEAKRILSGFDVIQEKFDIDEIQGEADEIINDKLAKAYAHLMRPCIVEDVSLEMEGLNGLPGPYIKHFFEKLGTEGLYDLVKDKDKKARAKAYIGYTDGKSTEIFVGSVEGRICKPSPVRRFAFDPIFIPEGYEKPFSELENKNEISHRRKALDKLREYLEGKK